MICTHPAAALPPSVHEQEHPCLSDDDPFGLCRDLACNALSAPNPPSTYNRPSDVQGQVRQDFAALTTDAQHGCDRARTAGVASRSCSLALYPLGTQASSTCRISAAGEAEDVGCSSTGPGIRSVSVGALPDMYTMMHRANSRKQVKPVAGCAAAKMLFGDKGVKKKRLKSESLQFPPVPSSRMAAEVARLEAETRKLRSENAQLRKLVDELRVEARVLQGLLRSGVGRT